MPGDAALAEEALNHDPQGDDEEADSEKERDGARPRCATATGRHDDTGHDSDQCQEERVVRPHGADRQAGCPQPPCHRVQGAAPGGGAPCHSSAGRRRHRTRAKLPRAATTTATRMTGRRSEPPPELPCGEALATAERCPSVDPRFCVPPVPSGPPSTSVVVVLPNAAGVVVVL